MNAVHEVSLAYSVVELVGQELSRHGGGVLRGIEMEVGSLSGVDPESFLWAMKTVWSHSSFADAELNVKQVAARAECRQCGKSFSPEHRYAQCPHCRGFAFRLLAGEEFRLIALTVERKK